MIDCNYNSLAFFRRYFHIPASRKLAWALILETVHDKREIRLGIIFSQTPHLYLDVARRRFFTASTIGNGALSRQVFPAKRTASANGFQFTTENGISREFHKNYIRDIYYTAVYSTEFPTQILY